MKNPIVIGFAGPMGSGKSTAIEVLKQYLNTVDQTADVKLVKFAAPLYAMQEAIYGIVEPVHTRPADFKKDRKLLQWLGTEWGRGTLGEDVWLRMFTQSVDDITADYDYQGEGVRAVIVCDDVRYDNEAELFKKMGGILIKLTTNRNGERIDTKAGIANHQSEAGVKFEYFDFVVENNGTVEQFQSSLVSLFQMIDNLANQQDTAA